MTETKAKTKAQRTFQQDMERLTKTQDTALQSALKLFASKDKTDAEFKTADAKLCAYIARRKEFAEQWTAEGTRKANIERAKRLVYFVRTRQESERFVGEIYRKQDDGEKILLTLSGHETARAAKHACYDWAAAESVNVVKSFRRFYEGELDYTTEMGKLAVMKTTAIEANHNLVMSGRKKGLTQAEFEACVDAAWIAITRFITRYNLCASQWSNDGKWIGAKKKVQKSVDPTGGEVRSQVEGKSNDTDGK